MVCIVGVCGGGKFWGLDNDGQSRLAVWLGLFFRQEVNADAAFREDGLDFQLSTHRLDVGTQGAEVHIGALLEFGYGALVDAEDLGEVGLGELAGGTKLLEGDFGHQLCFAMLNFGQGLRAHFGLQFAPLSVGCHGRNPVPLEAIEDRLVWNPFGRQCCAGAEAHRFLSGICGTTEVVPFYKAPDSEFFSRLFPWVDYSTKGLFLQVNIPGGWKVGLRVPDRLEG